MRLMFENDNRMGRSPHCSPLKKERFSLVDNFEISGLKHFTMETKTLAPELLHRIDAYWRAANYLSVGQIYLYGNPLLKRPLALADVKHMLLGHWGTTPG
jgi:hypothetical protein